MSALRSAVQGSTRERRQGAASVILERFREMLFEQQQLGSRGGARRAPPRPGRIGVR